MLQHEKAAPDVASDVDPDPHAFIRAAMEWTSSSPTTTRLPVAGYAFP
jgi:hypothetical protein